MHLIGVIAIYAGVIALLVACYGKFLLGPGYYALRRHPFLIWLAVGGVVAIVLGDLFL